MTSEPLKFFDLVWISLPNGGLQAKVNDAVNIVVGGQEVNGKTRYMSMVATAVNSEVQLVGFYAREIEEAKHLAYQLALFALDDLV